MSYQKRLIRTETISAHTKCIDLINYTCALMLMLMSVFFNMFNISKWVSTHMH